MRKLGTYKEGGFITTYCEDGLIISAMPSPFLDIEKFKSLPEGYKYPEPTWEDDPLVTRTWIIMDFETGTIEELK